MVPTSRVCLRVPFITISKSPAKEDTDFWLLFTHLSVYVNKHFSLWLLLCNRPACTLLLSSLTFGFLVDASL